MDHHSPAFGGRPATTAYPPVMPHSRPQLPSYATNRSRPLARVLHQKVSDDTDLDLGKLFGTHPLSYETARKAGATEHPGYTLTDDEYRD